MDLPHVVVVAASPQEAAAATAIAARLGPGARCAPSVAVAARSTDRRSVHAWVITDGELDAQVRAVRAAKGLPDALPVMVITDVTHAERVLTLLRAGADGVAPAGADVAVLGRCLVALTAGEIVLPRMAVRHVTYELRIGALRSDRTDSLLTDLSRREREVCVLLYAGLSTNEVAARLYVWAETVRSHLHAALHKLRLHSREELYGLLDSGR
jgi:DNA-binding NarL/FixJ family response regulator